MKKILMFLTGLMCAVFMRAGEPDTMNILLFGHSFGVDCTEHLPKLLREAGIGTVRIARVIKGNCSMEEHYGYSQGKKGFKMSCCAPGEIEYKFVKGSLDEFVSAYPWDYVVFQNSLENEGRYETAQPYLNKMMEYVREKERIAFGKEPEFCWNMFWPISSLLEHSQNARNDYRMSFYSHDTGEMWKAYVRATRELMADTGISKVIPSGTAIMNLRASYLNVPEVREFTRDGYHMSLGAGRYAAACVWFESLIAPKYGVSVAGNTLRLTDLKPEVTDDNAGFIQKCAVWSVGHPFEINPDLGPKTVEHRRRIGMLRRKLLSETRNDLTIGGEGLDRDYADYHSYKPYLDTLGMHFIRLQAGWAKTEKVKGVYDFSWLDSIIDDCVARGIEPFLETSYGNPVYEGGGTPYLAGGWPVSKEARKAWNKWVKTMAERYKGKVHFWEIWNEPELFIQPEPYIGAPASEYPERKPGAFESLVDLQTGTASIIKKVDPDAHIAACGLARLDPAFLDELLTAFEKGGKDKLFEYVTYHGYRYRPEDMYPEVEKMQEVLKRHGSHIRLWQGETGAPSAGGMGGALSDYKWSEISQGKWALRRIISDSARSIRTGLFCISENGFGNRDYVRKKNKKGLLETDDANKVKRAKYSFRAVCNLVSVYELFDEPLPAENVKICSKGSFSRYVFSDRESGMRSIVLWKDAKTPSNAELTNPVTVRVEGHPFRKPVCVDIRTGEIFSIPFKQDGDTQVLEEVPMYDSPVMIVEEPAVI